MNSLGDSIVSPSGVQISLCKLSSSSPRLKVLRCECRHHFVLSVFVALQEMTPEESHKEMLIHLANVIAVSSKRLCFWPCSLLLSSRIYETLWQIILLACKQSSSQTLQHIFHIWDRHRKGNMWKTEREIWGNSIKYESRVNYDGWIYYIYFAKSEKWEKHSKQCYKSQMKMWFRKN